MSWDLLNFLSRIRLSRDFPLFFLLFVSGLNSTFVTVTGINTHFKELLLLISIVMMIRAVYSRNIEYTAKIILTIAFTQNELSMFMLPLIMLPKLIQLLFSGKLFEKQLKFITYFFLFTIYAFMLLFITQLIDTAPFALFFWFVITGSGYLIFLYFLKKEYTAEQRGNILRFFQRIIFIQIPVFLLQSLIHRQFKPGDYWTGTFGDAIKSGFFLILFFLYLILPFIVVTRSQSKYSIFTVKRLLFLLLLVGLIYMDDSKILMLGTIISFPLFLMLTLFLKVRSSFGKPVLRDLSAFKSSLLIFLFVTCIGLIYNMADLYLRNLSKGSTDISKSWELYTSPDLSEFGVNNKYILYKRTFSEMSREHFVSWLFGTGPGKFGSRTSNMLAYDVLYKDPGQFRLPSFISPHSSEFVKKYMRDMWTEEVAEYVMWRSANLSFPFAGLVTVKAELGLIGLVVYVLILLSLSVTLLKRTSTFEHNNTLKRWCIVISYFWLAFPIFMIIDNYQEKPQIVVPMFIITAVLVTAKSSPPEHT
jgi:hypothetical protein